MLQQRQITHGQLSSDGVLRGGGLVGGRHCSSDGVGRTLSAGCRGLRGDGEAGNLPGLVAAAVVLVVRAGEGNGRSELETGKLDQLPRAQGKSDLVGPVVDGRSVLIAACNESKGKAEEGS